MLSAFAKWMLVPFSLLLYITTSKFLQGLRNVGAAADDWEASEIRFIDFGKNLNGILSEIEKSNTWVPHGLLNVALSTIVRHPSYANPVYSRLMLQGSPSMENTGAI